jgi:hypothetical protein
MGLGLVFFGLWASWFLISVSLELLFLVIGGLVHLYNAFYEKVKATWTNP